MSVVGDVYWPSPVAIRAFNAAETTAQQVLFAGQVDPLHHFLTAIQLLWCVEESVVADYIKRDDSVITYTPGQLVGQFKDVLPANFNYYQINRCLAEFNEIPALQFLTGELLQVYRSALSPLDRLAAVIAYFGQRP
jgi:hypothetical protein